jgi:hypothetical protein
MLDWAQVSTLANGEWHCYDPAEGDLACALGLPAAENLDIPALLRRLDQWAWKVRKATERLLRQFERQPKKFNGSEGYFRMMAMATVLQRDLGVRSTNKLSGKNPDCSDSRDTFVHGILEGNPGTCSPLATLYAAVAKRLNYPVRLVQRPDHLFARWEGPNGERFNIECTSRGFFSPTDDYYLSWPTPVGPDGVEFTRPSGMARCRIDETYYLRALTPREVISGCLIQRAYCLQHNGRHREAVEAACWAHELAPHHRPHEGTLWRLVYRWRKKMNERLPPPRPTLEIAMPPRRFPTVPRDAEKEIIHLEVLEDLAEVPEIRAAYRPPVRRSASTGIPIGLPQNINVRCSQIGSAKSNGLQRLR